MCAGGWEGGLRRPADFDLALGLALFLQQALYRMLTTTQPVKQNNTQSEYFRTFPSIKSTNTFKGHTLSALFLSLMFTASLKDK